MTPIRISRTAFGWILAACVAGATAHASDGGVDPAEQTPGPLEAAGPQEVDGRPGLVRLSGVVTFRRDEPKADRLVLVVQNNEAASWVVAPLRSFGDRPGGFADGATNIGPGHQVIVEGTNDPSSYGPRVIASAITVTGSASLPKAVPADVAGTFRGSSGPVRTVVTGIVQSVRSDKGVLTLALDIDGRRITVRSTRPPRPGVAEQLVDAGVRVTGIAGAVRNARGQFLGPVLMLDGFDEVERITPPTSKAFDAPFVPLTDMARFGTESLDGHRFQTEGTVTRSVPTRYLYIEDGGVGIRVETGDKEAYAPGDRVRVAGFLDTGRQLRGMIGAVTRRIGREPAPRAIETTPRRIAGGDQPQRGDPAARTKMDYAGRLVTFTATVADAGPTRDGGVLRLASDRTILEAVLLPEVYEAAATFNPGSEISVTGIVQYDVARHHEELVDGRLSPFERFSLLVHDASDLRVIRAAPWWTPFRLTAALAAVLTVLAAALAWAWSLRRQVALQAAAIAKEMRARREAAIEFQATLRERTRLAANLHDTLLQSMAGIGFQLEACQMSTRRSGEAATADAAEHLDVARRMVDHAVDDIRGSVWALRSAAVHGQSLTEAIEALVVRVGAGHRARIELQTRGEPFELPNFVSGNLLLIVQEAVFNAVRHGDPDLIDICVSFQTDDATVELSICDDGAGFSIGDQRGPEDGHFGLQGMRERAERLGGRLAVESHPGQGTAVRCQVRCRDYDPDMEGDDAVAVVAAAPAAVPR